MKRFELTVMRTWVQFPSPPPVFAPCGSFVWHASFLNEINIDSKRDRAKTVRRSLGVDGLIQISHFLIKTMYYVYLITSINYPEQIYVGYTTNVNERLVTHNNGGSVHTAKYKPWQLITYLGFTDKATALEFEKYLKSQSGRAFAVKRFIR